MTVEPVVNSSPLVERYSDNNDLGIFLHTLSYHRLGTEVFSCILMQQFRGCQDWTCADIGCGNGFFTRTLLNLISAKRIAPKSIYGLDPDTDNLRDYLNALRSFQARLVVERGIVQNLDVPSSDVILCSHSLYHALEEPTTSEQQKDALLIRLVERVNLGGLLLISMASKSSTAYRLKSLIHRRLMKKDLSVLGEDVAMRLDNLNISYEIQTHDSYADLSGVLNDPSALAAWLRYFCRLGHEELDSSNVTLLSEEVRSFLQRFGDLPIEVQSSYAAYPADKRLTDDSLLLPHAECFLIVRKGI